MSPHGDDVATAAELLNSSEQLRSDLLSAVAKLDSYIEQLRAVMPNKPETPREHTPPTP